MTQLLLLVTPVVPSVSHSTHMYTSCDSGTQSRSKQKITGPACGCDMSTPTATPYNFDYYNTSCVT